MNISINQSLVTGQSFLTADIAAGVTAIPVKNSETFTTANGLLLIGEIGSGNAELVASITSKTGTVVNLGSATSFIHQVGEPVYQVTYNQVEISRASSSTGSFTVLTTMNLQWSSTNTVFNDTTGTSGSYYRQRFYNTITGVYSDYSTSGVGVAQVDYNNRTAGYLINLVRKSVGNTNLSDDFFLNAINEARKTANTQFGYGRLQEYRQVFEYPVQMLAGTNYITLPTNIDFSDTNRSLICARFARQSIAANIPVSYIDKKEWNMRAYLNRYSWTNGAVTSGATSIVLDSTGDFAATGTLYVATEDPTATIMTVTYTGNNLTTNTLTGCSGVTANISDGVQVWAYSTFSIPYFYTIFDGKLWFERPIPNSLQGKNIFIDYYKRMEDIVFLTDEIPEHYRDLYIDYLKFAIKRRRDDSIGANDEDFKRFINGLSVINGNAYTGQMQIIS